MIEQPKLYKPVILRLADIGGLGSLQIFLLIVLTLGPVSYFLDSPVSNIVMLAYCSSVASFVTKRYRRYLEQVRPVLDMPNELYERYSYSMDHFTLKTIVLSAVAVPLAFLFVNRNSEGLANLFALQPQRFDFYYSVAIALLTWFVIWQLVGVLVANIYKFRQLAIRYAKVDLINIAQLSPFLMVGISTFWIFALSYAIVPIALIQHRDYLIPSLMSTLLTIPISLVVLAIPGWSIRGVIRKTRLKELDLVKQALLGDMNVLRDSRLKDEIDTLTTTSLVQYRQWLTGLSDWPMDDTALRKLFVYFVIPVVSWGSAFMFEQVVEGLL